jgi:hypothetical protein
MFFDPKRLKFATRMTFRRSVWLCVKPSTENYCLTPVSRRSAIDFFLLLNLSVSNKKERKMIQQSTRPGRNPHDTTFGGLSCLSPTAEYFLHLHSRHRSRKVFLASRGFSSLPRLLFTSLYATLTHTHFATPIVSSVVCFDSPEQESCDV